MELNSHLQTYRQPGSTTWSQDIDDYCNRAGLGGWEDRIKKQLLPVHLVAYLLIPENQGAKLVDNFNEQADDYILNRCGNKGYSQ
jgi:hypothetical protein